MSPDSPSIVLHSQRLLDSFRLWLGRELVSRSHSVEEDSRLLYSAPCIVVSHGTEADPLLNYGNAAALKLWEMNSVELIGMPSRLTAELPHREERARLLERTTRHGYVDDYRGIRITKTGRRFLIQQAIVWNVLDESGLCIGQAATFSDYEFLSPDK